MKTIEKAISNLKAPEKVTFNIRTRWNDEINFSLDDVRHRQQWPKNIQSHAEQNVSFKFNPETHKLDVCADQIKDSAVYLLREFARRTIEKHDKYRTPRASKIWKWFYNERNFHNDNLIESLSKLYDTREQISNEDILKVIHFLYEKYSK